MTRTPRLLTLVAAAAAAPLTGCMSLDGLLYNPEELQQYSLSGDVIPESAVELVRATMEVERTRAAAAKAANQISLPPVFTR